MNTEAVAPQPAAAGPFLIRAAIVVAVGIGVFFLCRDNPETRLASESGVVMSLPAQVGNFNGTPQEVSESERVILPGDTEFAKMLYTNFSGDQVNCQVVLSGGEKRSIHRPEICLPAQGWVKKSGSAIPVKLENGRTIDVMKLTIARPVEVQPGVRRELTSYFLYWFIGKGTTTAHHWQRILSSDWDRVVHGVSHRWAYVIVSAPILEGFTPGGKNADETLKMLTEFIGSIAPDIMKSEQS
ncbi:MAG: exosortase-associated EpsI family protein [Terrimicrobiaceae bacterium]|nr:exosortase-associated EpsI family protein [Terrimicrobiaceae bacterium]